ncbi:MoaD/ThiS family protein [Hyphobacterium sp.]|uniref:MoaD/ThiS family protein n=1 Tax=Hyphobacterium sp. TaxID=2004662 RepID=UPI003B52D57C
MRIALEFFGPIQDRLGSAVDNVELGGEPATAAALIEHLAETLDGGEALRQDHLRVALNDQLIGRHEPLQLTEGDRIAFLSPFSGG